MDDDKKYRNGILDNVIGSSGIKTDVTVSIPAIYIPILIGSIMLGVVSGILIASAISQWTFKK